MTYLKLIPQRCRRRYPDRAIQRMRYSNSLFVVYFGTDRKYDSHGSPRNFDGSPLSRMGK
jgi:hypothetical protein